VGATGRMYVLRPSVQGEREAAPMEETVTGHLRILVVGGRGDRDGLAAARVVGLGHDVLSSDIASIDASTVTANGWSDMALMEVTHRAAPALQTAKPATRRPAREPGTPSRCCGGRRRGPVVVALTAACRALR
jgi:hypothetical protein